MTARSPAHLEQFVFSEDVEVANVSASVAQLGVFGPLPRTSSSVCSVRRMRSAPISLTDLDGRCGVLANRTWPGAGPR